jgi:2-polyprenyl-6-methoxyphenol hydroxylase-like FAD-dependent oxidoreductase
MTAVVAGAGIGGLAAAVLLGRIGVDVTLIERVTRPAEVGAGLLLQPNGIAVLQALGLAEDLVGRGSPVSGGALRNGAGRRLTELSTPDFGDGLDAVVAIRRSVLHTALLDAVRDEPTVRCRFETSVERVTPDGTVQLRTPTGADEVHGDLVVGADGIGSVVRAGGSFGVASARGQFRYLRAIVPRRPGTPALTGEYWTAAGLFGGAALNNDDQYFYGDAAAPAVAGAVRARDLDALSRAWKTALPAAGALLAEVGSFDDLLINDVSVVTCRRWVDQHLVLLGDAAHAMAPTLGQGANSALVDAAVLASELTRHPLAHALQAYEERRRGRVSAVVSRAGQLARLASLRSPLARGFRDAAIRTAAALPGSAFRLALAAQQEHPGELVAELRRQIGPSRRATQ